MARNSGSTIAKVLPYLAIGGLFYLLAKNAGKLKSGAATGAVAAPPTGSPANNAGCNDFGASGTGCCWGG